VRKIIVMIRYINSMSMIFQDLNDEGDESNLLGYVKSILTQIEQDFVG
jgi:hypothetical protein